MNQPIFINLITFAILFLTSTSTGLSQEQVSIGMLQEVSHQDFPKASAQYLIKNSSVKYEINDGIVKMIVDYHTRIKIYDTLGLRQYGRFETTFFKNRRERETISKLKAYSYTLQNDQIAKTKVDKEDVEIDKSAENTNVVSLAFPNITKGSIIDIKYRIRSPFIDATPIHYFQSEIPVKSSTFKINVPERYDFIPITTGTKQVLESKGAQPGSDDAIFVTTAKDVPPIIHDEYVLNIDDYTSSLKFELAFESSSSTGLLSYLFTWQELSKFAEKETYRKSLKSKLLSTKPFLSEIRNLNPEQKIKRILYAVRSQVDWNNEFVNSNDQTPQETLNLGSGSTKDINILLCNLLRKAGIDAYIVITKPRSWGLIDTSSAKLSGLDYTLVAVKTQDSYNFVDASAKYTPYGELPIRATNTHGLIVDRYIGGLIEIPNNKVIKIKEAAQFSIDLKQGNLKGSGTSKKYGFATTKDRIKNDKSENFEDFQDLEGGYFKSKDLYEFYEVTGFEDVNSAIESRFDATIYDGVNIDSSQITISTFLLQKFDAHPFSSPDRNHPIHFNTAYDLKSSVILEKPAGYQLISSPKDCSIKIKDDQATFTYITSEDENKIVINYHLMLNKTTFEVEQYTALKQFFDMVLDKQKETLILKKS